MVTLCGWNRPSWWQLGQSAIFIFGWLSGMTAPTVMVHGQQWLRDAQKGAQQALSNPRGAVQSGANTMQNNLNNLGRGANNFFNQSSPQFSGGNQARPPQANQGPIFGDSGYQQFRPPQPQYRPPQQQPQRNYQAELNRMQQDFNRQQQQMLNQGWADVGRQLGNALGNMNQPQPQPRSQPQPRTQQPRQDYYQPDYYQQPRRQNYEQPQYYEQPRIVQPQPQVVPSTPVVSIPKNAVPTPAPALSLTSTPNLFPGNDLAAITPAGIERISPEISGLMQQDYEDFQAAHDSLMDELIDGFLDNPYNDLLLPPDLKEALGQALKDRDFGAAIDLLNQNELSQLPGSEKSRQALENYITHLADIQALADDLSGGLQSGDSLNDLQTTFDQLYGHLTSPGISQFADLVGKMGGSLERIENLLLIEDLLLAGPPSQPPSWSLWDDRPLWICYDPGLQPGQYFYAGDDVIVVYREEGPFGFEQGTFSEALRMPFGIGPAAAAIDSPSNSSNAAKLLIRNPTENGLAVSFQLDGKNYDVPVGGEQLLTISGKRVLKFDSGTGNGGTQQFTVDSGSYNFRLRPPEGWKFFQAKFNVTIDNSQGKLPFHFVMDGQQKTVTAGETLKLSADFPPEVQFDPGNDAGTVTRRLEQSEYTVAIDPARKGWDLFASVLIAGQPPVEEITPPSSPTIKPYEKSRKPRWQSNTKDS